MPYRLPGRCVIVGVTATPQALGELTVLTDDAPLYMMHFTPGPTLPFHASWGLAPIGLWRAACHASTPLFGFKQLTNVVQLYMACEALVEEDEKKRKQR